MNPIVPASPAHSLHSRLVSFWKLEEAVANNRLDAYTKVPTADKTAVNDLIPNAGAPTNGAGKIGNALYTASVLQQTVSIVSNSSLQIASGQSFTIAAWLYLTTKPGTAARAVSKADSGGGILEYALRYATGSNRIGLAVNDSTGLHNGAVDDTTAISTATWYFAVAFFDNPGNLIGVSVNDNTPTTAAYSFDINPGAGPFLIGGTNTVTAFFWNGRIDAVGLWKRLLTAEEKTWLYRAGTGVEFPFA